MPATKKVEGKEWKLIQVKDCLELQNGYPFKPAQWSKAGLPIIRIQNLNNTSAPFNFCNEQLPEKFKIKHGDLLFAWSGTPGTSFGAHVWQGGDAWLNQHIFRVGYDPQVFNRDFLRFAINDNLREYILQAHGGAGLAHITKKQFDISYLKCPPLAEQEEIVRKMQTTLPRVRGAQEKIERAKMTLHRFRKGVLSVACNGKLTVDWRGKTEESDDVPNTWHWLPVKDIAEIRGGIQKQPHRKPRNNAFPYLRVANVQRNSLDLSEMALFELEEGELEKYRLLHGDMLIVEGNGSSTEIGRSAIWHEEIRDCVHQNHIIRVRFNAEKCLAEYANLFWNSPQGSEEVAAAAVTTSGLYSLSTKKIAAIAIPLPPVDEQKEIVRRVHSYFEIADRVEAAITKIENDADLVSSSILARAFSQD